MGSIDLAALERAARRRYEAVRLSRAALGFAPAWLIVATAALVGRQPGHSLAFGAALFAAGVFLLWRGRALQRAVLPGVLAGLVPLAFSLTANLVHGCASGHCGSYCVPACSAGGLLAGAIVSTFAVRRRMPWSFWLAAGALSLMTGAMGCACIGYSGVLGLAAGFSVGLAPQLLRRALGRA